MFPLKAQQYKKKEKYIHILLFIACKYQISLTEINKFYPHKYYKLHVMSLDNTAPYIPYILSF